jgi:Protein of unknown function (DUF2950)
MRRNTLTQRLKSYAAICTLLWFWPVSWALADRHSARQGYASPEEAAAALASAARSHDQDALSVILGSGSEKLLSSGDRYGAEELRRCFAAAYDEKHTLVPEGPERVELHVGNNDWPLPIAIVQEGRWNRWMFDAKPDTKEIIDRRIGRNEQAAIRVASSYVDAQKDYFQRAKQRTGTGYYAERLISTSGRYDSLFRITAARPSESPFGPLMTQAQSGCYSAKIVNGRLIRYQGYYFRVVKAQGPNAPGGAMSYMTSGLMTRGHALIAWPAIFGSSGIMTFQVDQDGVVFRKDLGARTSRIASRITQFDPDPTWVRVEVTNR